MLPVREETPQPGILVIASREPDSYSADHLELMRNIGLLVSLSFAKTVQLAERTRLAAIGEFSAGIVHELRTPLATIALALEYLRGADMPPPAARRVELAAAEADRMSRLMSEVLQYARPLSLETTRIDANRLLKNVIEDHAELGGSRAIHVETAGTPIWIDADVDRLTQVILNLTANAVEASPEGGAVQWRVEGDGESVRLSVTNRGQTISIAERARLFEPFYTTKAGGTGLGLSIVKRIAEAHGGEITVRSDDETGTRFDVLVPASASGQ